MIAQLLALSLLLDARSAHATLAGAAEPRPGDGASLVPRLEAPALLRAAFPRLAPSGLFGARPKRPNKPPGFLVANLDHGLYFGRPHPKRPDLFTFSERERDAIRVARKRGNSKLPGGRAGLQATWYLTPRAGINVETRVGRGWFAGLSFVYRW